MLSGYARVSLDDETITIPLRVLEIAQIVCKDWEVDAEPTGNGAGWKVSARKDGVTVSKTGQSLTEAVKKLIESIT